MKRTTVSTQTVRAANRKANRKRNTEYAADQADVVKAVARALNGISAPRLDARLKSMFGAAVGDLLRGGYELDLIRTTAVNLATTTPQRLADLRAHVRQAQANLDHDAHIRRKREEAAAPTPEAIATVRLMRDEFRRNPITDWTAKCGAEGCTRTALSRRSKCADHDRG